MSENERVKSKVAAEWADSRQNLSFQNFWHEKAELIVFDPKILKIGQKIFFGKWTNRAAPWSIFFLDQCSSVTK